MLKDFRLHKPPKVFIIVCNQYKVALMWQSSRYFSKQSAPLEIFAVLHLVFLINIWKSNIEKDCMINRWISLVLIDEYGTFAHGSINHKANSNFVL